jgi:hypothetical protein
MHREHRFSTRLKDNLSRKEIKAVTSEDFGGYFDFIQVYALLRYAVRLSKA